MSWKAIHRWLGLTLGTLAVVLGITGAILAIDPVQQAWQAPAAPGNLPVATLVERVARSVPHAEEIRRLPSGAIVVFSFAGDQPQASYVDPADGQVLGAWQASALPRWVKNLHRSLLLGDAGRWGAAGIALTMGLLCVSGPGAVAAAHGRLAAAGGTGAWLAGAAHPRGYGPCGARRAVPHVAHGADHERIDLGAGGTGHQGRARGDLVGHRQARRTRRAADNAAKPQGAGFAQADFSRRHRPRGHLEGRHRPGPGLD